MLRLMLSTIVLFQLILFRFEVLAGIGAFLILACLFTKGIKDGRTEL